MTTSFNPTLVDGRHQVFTDALDADNPTLGKFQIYSGTRPANGAAITSQVLLIELRWPIPSYDTVVGQVLTLNLPAPVLALADGTATWVRHTDGADVHVADMSAGVVGSGADVEMTSVAVFAGGQVSVTSATMTET